ncbi:unnamed protein product [Paramecium pentaurelia]|uniref:Leucine Rich Repeat family protein n=1 Tax=Paramecium pentaurelia TaxID=43138 RepID=A0A8S1Y2Y0_9CILI|nr:unnamed protein product [Paramecium pentaurelia]
MLFEKLKIYNTPAKLLEKLREVRKIQETEQKTDINQVSQVQKTEPSAERYLVRQLSFQHTWNSLTHKSPNLKSPTVKSQVDIFKTQVASPKLRSYACLTDISTYKKSQARTNLEDDSLELKDLQKNLETETLQELYNGDQKLIEQLNDEAQVLSERLAFKDDKSPVRPFQRKHHQPNLAQKPQRRGGTVIAAAKLEDLKKHQPFLYNEPKDAPFDDLSDRGKFLKHYRLGNKNLQKINQKEYRSVTKNYEKLEDYADFYKQQPNIYLQLNKSSQKHNIFQTGLGLINSNYTIQTAESSGMLRNEQKIKVFTEALKSPQCKTLTDLKLSHNQLTSPRIKTLVSNFPSQVQDLDLNNNGIDSKGCEILGKYLQKSRVKKLSLENNKIGDQGANYLFQAFQENDYLTLLNLSRNNLTEGCSIELSNYLKKSNMIFELYLHFNTINSKGGLNIWKSLYKNSSVKVFDISYNRTGSFECAQQMAKVIAKPYPELMHIDVSHNGFDEPSANEIMKALNINQNIYGFHFEGNCPKFLVDATGHLRNQEVEEQIRQKKIEQCRKNPQTSLRLLDDDVKQQPKVVQDKKQEKIQQVHRFRRIWGMKPVKQNQQYEKNRDSCWICEGWEEVKFTWSPGKSGGMNNDPIFLHVNFDGYRPVLMSPHQGEYHLYRMCPPNQKILYFFSNPILGIQTTAKNQMIMPTPINDPIAEGTQEFLYNGDILIEGNKMSFVNEVFTEGKHTVVDKYVPKIFSKPREEERTYDLTQYMNKKQTFWSYEISIFKNYQPDNEELIDECFEYDFQSSKINRIVRDPNELMEIKELLREYYPHIFASYKFYASTLIGSSIPCISSNAFFDFIGQTTIMTDKFRPGDIDLNFISTSNVKDILYPNVYEKALIRYQFMEVLVRIALDKYTRTGICKSMKLSVLKLFEDDLVRIRLQEIDRAQDWRDLRLWNEQCDLLIKDRLPMLKLLFKFTSKLNSKLKFYKQTWVQFKDFRDLLLKCDLYCDTFVERDAYIAYLLSMQTQIDELYSLRHFQMEFYEFIEALCRCAEKLSLIRTKEIMNVDERRVEPLHKKIDALFLIIYLRAGDAIKQQLKESEDFSDFDRCMTRKQKNLKQQIEEMGSDDDDKPYNPAVELKFLEDQLKQATVQPVQSGPKLKKALSLFTVLKQMQQQKQLKSNFLLTNVVQYFKQRDEEYMQNQIDEN